MPPVRRLHVPALSAGSIQLQTAEAHHARDVLRLASGDPVELFDDAGAVAPGTIERCDRGAVIIRVARVESPARSGPAITVAAAVPKGERADWMVEKLSELGVDRFIPVQAERSVVLPAGRNKRERWQRLATESGKQSRRAGIMRIEELVKLDDLLHRELGDVRSMYLSTASDAPSLLGELASRGSANLQLLIGPEGGWTEGEQRAMREAQLTAVKLTATILRIETAAVAAAAIVAIWRDASSPSGYGPTHSSE